jgi:hypothetical protein
MFNDLNLHYVNINNNYILGTTTKILSEYVCVNHEQILNLLHKKALNYKDFKNNYSVNSENTYNLNVTAVEILIYDLRFEGNVNKKNIDILLKKLIVSFDSALNRKNIQTLQKINYVNFLNHQKYN